jgi:hypothetical protein
LNCPKFPSDFYHYGTHCSHISDERVNQWIVDAVKTITTTDAIFVSHYSGDTCVRAWKSNSSIQILVAKNYFITEVPILSENERRGSVVVDFPPTPGP